MYTSMSKEEENNFLEELQALGEPTKRKILIVATAIIMVIVVYVWFGYFNGLVTNVSQSPVAQSQEAQTSTNSGFFQTIGNAAMFIGGECVRAIHAVKDLFQKTGQYVVTPQNN